MDAITYATVNIYATWTYILPLDRAAPSRRSWGFRHEIDRSPQGNPTTEHTSYDHRGIISRTPSDPGDCRTMSGKQIYSSNVDILWILYARFQMQVWHISRLVHQKCIVGHNGGMINFGNLISPCTVNPWRCKLTSYQLWSAANVLSVFNEDSS